MLIVKTTVTKNFSFKMNCFNENFSLNFAITDLIDNSDEFLKKGCSLNAFVIIYRYNIIDTTNRHNDGMHLGLYVFNRHKTVTTTKSSMGAG